MAAQEGSNKGDTSAHDGRDETPLEQLDRNWTDLLQELRVAQTGVQLLSGFLLTLPFQTKFADLSTYQRGAYLATVASAIVATGFLIAPVALHRVVFRQHVRRAMVKVAHRLALVGISLLAVAVIGVVLLTFSVVVSDVAGVIAAALAFVLLSTLWAVVPLALRGDAPGND